MAEETEELSFQARLRRAQDTTKSWIRQKRRERAAKKKAGSNKGLLYGLMASLVILLVGFAMCLNYMFSNDVEGRRIGLHEVAALADQGRINTAEIKDADNEIVGTYEVLTVATNPKTGKPVQEFPKNPDFPQDSPANDHISSGTFHTSLPSSGQAYTTLVQQFKTSGTQYSVDKQSAKQVVRTVATFLLPLMILANLFALLFSLGKGSGSAIGEVMTYDKIGRAHV